MSSKCVPKTSVNSVCSVREKTSQASLKRPFSYSGCVLFLTERHRRTEHTAFKASSGPSPVPSPKGRGVITEIPLWGCLCLDEGVDPLRRFYSYSSTPITHHPTPVTHHPTPIYDYSSTPNTHHPTPIYEAEKILTKTNRI